MVDETALLLFFETSTGFLRNQAPSDLHDLLKLRRPTLTFLQNPYYRPFTVLTQSTMTSARSPFLHLSTLS